MSRKHSSTQQYQIWTALVATIFALAAMSFCSLPAMAEDAPVTSDPTTSDSTNNNNQTGGGNQTGDGAGNFEGELGKPNDPNATDNTGTHNPSTDPGAADQPAQTPSTSQGSSTNTNTTTTTKKPTSSANGTNATNAPVGDTVGAEDEVTAEPEKSETPAKNETANPAPNTVSPDDIDAGGSPFDLKLAGLLFGGALVICAVIAGLNALFQKMQAPAKSLVIDAKPDKTEKSAKASAKAEDAEEAADFPDDLADEEISDDDDEIPVIEHGAKAKTPNAIKNEKPAAKATKPRAAKPKVTKVTAKKASGETA